MLAVSRRHSSPICTNPYRPRPRHRQLRVADRARFRKRIRRFEKYYAAPENREGGGGATIVVSWRGVSSHAHFSPQPIEHDHAMPAERRSAALRSASVL